MSRLRISHRTRYRYAEPVTFARHRLVVRPREGHDVWVEKQVLEIHPAHRLIWRRDLFGNSIALVDFLEPSDSLDIHNDLVVARRDGAWIRAFDDFEPAGWPVIYSVQERPVATGYLEPVYPEESAGLRAWLALQPWAWISGDSGSGPPPKHPDAIAFIQALSTWIYAQINYRRREEKGVQSPMETLRLRSGSCRDMATLMLESLRAAGIAARFASGYLDSAASAAGMAATHAWVEFCLPEQGWGGCDPTLDEAASLKHVLTGVSSHPRGVMPVSGSFIGRAGLFLGLTVSVKIEHLSAAEPLSAPPSQPPEA